MCFMLFCGFPISLHHSRLQDFQSVIAGGNQTSLDAERKSQHRALRMADCGAKDDGHTKGTQKPLADVMDRWATFDGRLGVRKFAEDNALKRVELPCLL